MTSSHVFISHSSKDDTFVKALREELEALGIKTWIDSRELIGGSKLAPEIEEAIEGARQFVVVLSTNTINSLGFARRFARRLRSNRGVKMKATESCRY
jgi:TIR domain